MAGEPQIALGVLIIASKNDDRIATFKECYEEIPKLVILDNRNLVPSGKRPGELMWEQIVRNIKSHFEVEGNFIYEGYLTHVPDIGYRIEDKGITYLGKLGLA